MITYMLYTTTPPMTLLNNQVLCRCKYCIWNIGTHLQIAANIYPVILEVIWVPLTSERKANGTKDVFPHLALPTRKPGVVKVWPISAKKLSWVPCTHCSLCLCFLGWCQSKAGCQIKLCSECYVPSTKAIKLQSLVQKPLPHLNPHNNPSCIHLYIIKAMED